MKIYCILCEEMADLEENCHTSIIYQDVEIGLSELGICCFPLGFAYCPPPDSLFESILDEDEDSDGWDLWVEENQPSDEEILVSDLNAVELREEMEQA